jgi:hypothetical protein
MNRVGELAAATTSSTGGGSASSGGEEEEEGGSAAPQRAVVARQAGNVQGLTDVVVGSNADLFLRNDPNNATEADEKYGPMAAGLAHCAAVWPLQTPCYAALTLALDVNCAVKAPDYAGFGERVVQYAVHMLSRDLDSLLLEQSPDAAAAAAAVDEAPRAVTRLRLTLRYVALLASAGVVLPRSDRDDEEAAASAAIGGVDVSLAGLLDAMARAALQAASGDRLPSATSVCWLLTTLVWSTIPYVTALLPSDWIARHLIEPLQEVTTSHQYRSIYAPGVGSRAILLKAEQLEDIDGDQDEEESDEEEEDDDDDESGQICDSFQDLKRSVEHYLRADSSPRFALFSDAPWKELKEPAKQTTTAEAATTTTTEASEEGNGKEMEEQTTPGPLKYSGDPIPLRIFPTCASLTLLLGGEVPEGTRLGRADLSGVIFGRLPMFGPPAGADGDEEEEDEDMEEEPTNERLQAYKTNFGLVDRYFVGEAVRDLLLSHESCVSEAGVERGSAKMAAEQVLSLRHMWSGADDDPSKGIEYAILETILSLVAQCSSVSAFHHVYLSRVLLELTRLEPAVMSPAIALAVSNLFQDYMPSLAPAARTNLSRWFAFHLINTEFQWPAAYWKHWEPFVLHGWGNSRGAFVKGSLAVMLENLSNPGVLVKEALPKESAIAEHLLPTPLEGSEQEISALASVEDEIKSRIYSSTSEAAETLLSYLLGDEVGESIAGALAEETDQKDRTWVRTGVVIRAMLAPARSEYVRLKTEIEKARTTTDDDDDAMDEETDGAGSHEDVLSLLLRKFALYKSVLLGVMKKDAESQGGAEVQAFGELFLLNQLEESTIYSRSLLEGCIQAFLKHKFVTVESIFKWLLGESRREEKTQVALRWWELASLSLQLGMIDAVAENGGASTDMAIDGEQNGGANGSPAKANRALQFLDSLLSYSVRRVGTLLNISSQEVTKGNKLTPEQVDLVEGFKFIVAESRALYLSLLRDGSTPGVALQDAWAESAVGGPSLASLLDMGGPSVELLRRILDRM